MATKTQQIIIPRNWLFGRINFVYANLNNLLSCNPANFTEGEKQELRKARHILKSILNNKLINNEELKKQIKDEKL